MQHPLPFPRVVREKDKRGRVISEEYIIPDEKKWEVIDEMRLFDCPAKPTTRMIDIHCDRHFTARRFKVVHESGSDWLVSPYYYSSRGTAIDCYDSPRKRKKQVSDTPTASVVKTQL